MAQSSRAVLLLLALTTTAAAWLKPTRQESWRPSKETVTIGDQLGWSPRPTDGPQALLGGMELLPRLEGYTLASGTCAYVSSNGISFTCLTDGNTCTYSGGYLGCCDTSTGCSMLKTTCIDYFASRAGSCDLPNDFHTICCASSILPACYTWVLSTTGTGDQPDETFTLLDCSAQSGTGTLLDYDPSWSRTHSFASSTTGSSSSATATDSGGGSSTPVGAIAGGVVGGVAALALVALAVFLLLRRRGHPQTRPQSGGPQSNPQSPSMGQQGLYPQGAYTTGYPVQGPQGQQQYDPRLSTFNQPPIYPNAGQYQQYPQPGTGQGSPQQQIWQPAEPSAGPQPYNAPFGGYQASSVTTATDQQHVEPTPSPVIKDDITSETTSSGPTKELETVAPLGMESNRAELGGPENAR